MIISNKIKNASSIVIGYSTCLLIIYFAHAHLIQPPEISKFDPATSCTKPPTECWDGFSKPFYKCVSYSKSTEIRPSSVVAEGAKSCYKSVYWNLDSTTFYMAAWFFLWAAVTSRGIESIALAFLSNNVRYPIMIGTPHYTRL
jgi:hypothetical protein